MQHIKFNDIVNIILRGALFELLALMRGSTNRLAKPDNIYQTRLSLCAALFYVGELLAYHYP